MQKITNRKCRHCERGILNIRVKRPWMVKVFFFYLPLRKYKCDACSRATYLYGRKPKHIQLEPAQH